MHHGKSDSPIPMSAALGKLVEDPVNDSPKKPGPTGLYPGGKISESDEGEICFLIGNKAGRIFLDFGVPVQWVGLSSSQALDLADDLQQHARAAKIKRRAK